ncbi:MAG: restriction endonuclease subunit S, partial [Pseudomonas sp.]|nr:restriction endonuclease subunit S [Pseudomonas sp.]
ISPETDELMSRSRLEAGDVLFSIAGTIGKTCSIQKEDLPANTNQALAIIRGTSTVFLQDFLLSQLDSFVSEKIKERARGGAMPNVSLGDLSDLVLVIPPLAEQHRIVAKVDELMALCDQLKARLNQARQVHEHLASALVEQAVA